QPVQVPVAADQAKLAATVAIPATTPSPRSMEADPLAESPTLYDPQGLRTGNFIWRPAIEVSAGGTTNVQSSHDGISSSALRLAPELVGQSDWSRHAFGIDLRGAFTEFPADRSLYRPTVNANATGRVDITDEMRLNLKAGYAVDKLPAASTQLAAGTSTAGYQQTITASVGLTQEFGRFAVTLRGDVDRTVNEVSSIGGTATTAATPLDSTHYVAALRGTFAWTEAVKPFLEGDLTLRRYDDAVVATGVAPPTDLSSRGYIGKTGVVLDFGPMLSGEASVGYGREKPYDASLSAVDGMTFDGSLIWSPTRLTRVTFNATTAFESTLLTGASGAIAHTAGVKVADDLRRNLTAELGGSVLLRDYTGVSRRETIASANAALIWKWNPHLQTFLRASYDNYASTAGDDDYRTTTVFAGLRLQ
ncbi:MAG: outer membrane beta-barrel protein, partial [Ancalomicrobiaceae bacterium]|nr:outer membrane beta-barrel protein [Ancalomicrobiaceae bacterium]